MEKRHPKTGRLKPIHPCPRSGILREQERRREARTQFIQGQRISAFMGAVLNMIEGKEGPCQDTRDTLGISSLDRVFGFCI
jgi:hypothetical protein